QNHSVYANAAATAKATHKAEATEQPEDKDEPEGTREANTSPWCAGITPGAATPEANAPDQQPRAARIAKAYGVPYKDVIGWFCKGYGLGQVDRAYAIVAAKGNITKVSDVFDSLAAGKNWKQILTDANLSMKEVNQARKAAFGHGKGNGKGKGNGNGNG